MDTAVWGWSGHYTVQAEDTMDTAVWGWSGYYTGNRRYRLRTPWIQLYGGGLGTTRETVGTG